MQSSDPKQKQVLVSLMVALSIGQASSNVQAAPAKQRTVRVTGAYECNVGNRKNDLYVKELPNHKLQFAMNSLYIVDASNGNVRTGQAGGTAVLSRGGEAIYDNGCKSNDPLKMKIVFRFAPNKCTVDCDSVNVYGGVGVDPNGVYKRVSKAVPTAAQLEVDN